MNDKKRIFLHESHRLLLMLELRHLLVSALAGAIGLVAYDARSGIIFFVMFFVMMQPFLIGEYLRSK